MNYATRALGAMLLAGCATTPANVQPAFLPADSFGSASCNEARALYAQTAGEVATLSRQQQQTADADALGVFLIGIPAGSLSGGGVETELANAKGRLLALDRRLARCPR